MNILTNEKIQEYFGCEDHLSIPDSICTMCTHPEWRAWEVLQEGMQHPIKRGEKVLRYLGTSCFVESTALVDDNSFHPFMLRLPERFQKKADPVEERIATLTSTFSFMNQQDRDIFERDLRGLVALARITK